ncbi:hypothetical protein TYRP_008587, partial [Tyrophagus putrescentiae]
MTVKGATANRGEKKKKKKRKIKKRKRKRNNNNNSSSSSSDDDDDDGSSSSSSDGSRRSRSTRYSMPEPPAEYYRDPFVRRQWLIEKDRLRASRYRVRLYSGPLDQLPQPRPSGHVVYVDNLKPLVGRGHLFGIFGKFGHVLEVHLPRSEEEPAHNLGYAYIEYEWLRGATKAAFYMHRGLIDFRRPNVYLLPYQKKEFQFPATWPNMVNLNPFYGFYYDFDDSFSETTEVTSSEDETGKEQEERLARGEHGQQDNNFQKPFESSLATSLVLRHLKTDDEKLLDQLPSDTAVKRQKFSKENTSDELKMEKAGVKHHRSSSPLSSRDVSPNSNRSGSLFRSPLRSRSRPRSHSRSRSGSQHRYRFQSRSKSKSRTRYTSKFRSQSRSPSRSRSRSRSPFESRSRYRYQGSSSSSTSSSSSEREILDPKLLGSAIEATFQESLELRLKYCESAKENGQTQTYRSFLNISSTAVPGPTFSGSLTPDGPSGVLPSPFSVPSVFTADYAFNIADNSLV